MAYEAQPLFEPMVSSSRGSSSLGGRVPARQQSNRLQRLLLKTGAVGGNLLILDDWYLELGLWAGRTEESKVSATTPGLRVLWRQVMLSRPEG